MASNKAAIPAFAALFDQQECCDVMFQIGENQIGAHRAFIKARSEVLDRLIDNREVKKQPTSQNQQKPVVITNTSFGIFKDVLRYIYSDEINLTNDNVVEIMHAAVRFKIDNLEGRCAEHLSRSINKENVMTYVQEAVDFNAEALKVKCGNVFGRYATYFCRRPEFCSLSQPVLSALLGAENMEVLEISLFRHVKKWMERQCETAKLPKTGSNMRSLIGDALYKIRFPTMSVWDFANEVTTIDGFLTEAEIAQVFRKITTFDNKERNCQFPDMFRFTGLNFNPDNPILTQKMCKNQAAPNGDRQYREWMSLSEAFHAWSNNQCDIDARSTLVLLQCCYDQMITPKSNCNRTVADKQECLRLFKQWQRSSIKKIEDRKTNFNLLYAALSKEDA